MCASVGMAQTTPPAAGHVIYVPPGATVVMLPGPGSAASPNVVNAGAPEAMPMMRLIAQQQAAMQQMFADMNAMFPPMPDPNAMLRAAFGPGGPFAGTTCHCEKRSDEAIPCLTSAPRLVRQGIASSLRFSQ